MKIQDMVNELGRKWQNLQKAMEQEGIEGCLLTINMNLYYVTGEVFNGYFYLPVGGEPYFFIRRPIGEDTENCFHVRKPEQIPEILRKLGKPLPQKLGVEEEELPYSEVIRLQHIFQLPETRNISTLLRRQRMIKTPWEIEQMRCSARKHEAVYREIPRLYRPGMTDIDFQIELEHCMRLHGSIGYFRAFGVNMDIFMGSVLVGENAERPSPFDFALGGAGVHSSAPLGANGTKLVPGKSVMVDMSGNYTAYQTDMTRVFSVGRLPERAYRAHQTALEIQAEMEQKAKPGIACAELYTWAVQKAAQEGWKDNFMGTRQQAKFIGHGVGLQINELPVLTPRSKEVLQPGMTFAFEPKFVWPGIGAVGIENTFLVTETGVEKMTLLEENILPLE